MGEKNIVERIEQLVAGEMALLGLELIETSFKSGLLRLVIDKPGGVTMEDCVVATRRVGLLLDAEDPIQGSFRLEVTSPGLNRRLRTVRDFEYFAGRLVKVLTKEGSTVRGTLKGISGDTVLLEVEDQEIRLNLHDIAKANLDFEF